jgi:hypothetical protein
MESVFEKTAKLALVVVVGLAFLLYWIVPKLALAHRLRMNETLFMLTNILGAVCGALGLAATFIWPDAIVELHLWELIIVPWVLIQVYWLIILRIRKSDPIVDEKQEFDMSQAAGLTMALTILAMALLFTLFSRGVLAGLTWFPYYLFTTVLCFSASTIYYFKRA